MNPYHIKKDDCPLIVLSTNSSGFIAMWIRWRTKSYYSHAMTQIWLGEFQSQGNIFSSTPIERYLTKQGRLKYWRIKDLTHDEKMLIKTRIIDRLNKKRPWWRRFSDYDHLGIIGAAIGVPWINNPLRTFCSEQVTDDVLKGVIDLAYRIDDNIYRLPQHPTPKDINEFFKLHPRMEVFGRWDKS